MKKTTMTILAAGLLIVSGLKAQTVQEGISHLNAGRVKTATGIFDKILAVNPNNIEATYWLGQSYLDLEEIAGARIKSARGIYEKGLQSSANAPLLLVGLGHVELLENKTSDARQKFETALTMTKTKKGDDPAILAAVGRANVDAKTGDYNYAVEKLKALTDKGEKNPDAFVMLGNAYRKAGNGSGGGDAFASYKKALEMNSGYALASLRLAKLFESQKNWELVLQYLNEAVTKDPKFTAAYYDLFYYYFFRAKFPEAEDQLKKYIDSKLPDSDIQDQYLYAQLCWARKDFDCAITKAQSVVTAMGALTKPKVYRLLADAYYQKGDYANAKKYSDEFFAKKNPEDVILPDYEIKADVLSKTGGTPEDIMNAYMAGFALDTTVEAKVGFLKKGAVYFKANKIRDKEGDLVQKIIDLKPKPTINDYFDLTLARYFSGDYARSRSAATVMIEKYADQPYGYEWKFNSSMAVDTVKKDSIAVPDALELYGFAQKDTAKYKKQYLSAVKFLGAYYINQAKDKEKSLEYFTKWLEADSANAETIQGYIDQIKKMPATKPSAATPSGNPMPKKPVASQPAAKTTKKTTTVVKK
jgi:tetratricopeptide (TPR) repeat protein